MATNRTEDLERMSRNTASEDDDVQESGKASVAERHETGVELTPLENGHDGDSAVAAVNDQQETEKPAAQPQQALNPESSSTASAAATAGDSPTRTSHRRSRSHLTGTTTTTTTASDRRTRHHRAGSERHMGHYPPRQAQVESRQESPPTAFVDAPTQLTESWNDISNQFEESVGKPSREALHKFFYPPGNNNNSNSNNSGNNLSAHPQQQAIHRRRVSQPNLSDRNVAKAKGKIKARKSTTEIQSQQQQQKQQQPSSQEENAIGDSSSPAAASEEPRIPPLQQSISAESHNSRTPPITTGMNINQNENNNNQNQIQSQAQTLPQQQQEQQPIQIHSSMSRNSSFASLPGGVGQFRSPRQSALQHSFDVEEEEDRKYVERFWTIYDDIIMLSLFTNLGVVARLAASTWFTFFDGVFRADSPLFTNLPLNCMSCFLLGLLGSGERLMETVTTRFTPRNLQQSIVQDQSCDNETEGGGCYISSDDDNENHCYYDDGGDDTQQGEGLRRRNRGRRPKRSKRKKAFHSWQPPLHWHDDLREVQLLALERRIRASKCLLLFPVAKEDADVMEHYFGEGYKASVGQQRRSQRQRQPQQQQQQPQQRSQNAPRRRRRRRRRRRGFERQKYSATNLADTDSADSPRRQTVGFDDSESCDDESDLDDNGEYQRNQSGEGAEDNDDEYEDDGLFRFDLELTESTEMTPVEDADSAPVGNGVANGLGSPSRMQKLIKRPPGRISESPPRQTDTPSATTRSHLEAQQAPNATMPQSQRPVVAVATNEPDQPRQTQSAAAQPNVTEEAVSSSLGTPVHEDAVQPNDSYLATVARSAAGVPMNSDAETRSLGTASGGEGGDPQLEQIISNVQANVSENISRLGRVNLADGWDVGTTPEAMADDLMLGLRDGFCGALSSFSSWNSSMLNLLREGHIGEAFVGYLLGLQLPIVAYRFGQQVAVYFFVWRCRREARREARKGWYGIRVKMDGSDDESDGDGNRRRARTNSSDGASSVEEFFDERSRDKSAETLGEDPATLEVPSVRAICTALYLLALVTQCTSLNFFANPEDQQIALSLLFSPVGTLTRWRLSQLNSWRPGFPIGTFACNILACALSGSLGSVLAGNPGPRERIFLQSFIAGFGGTLSSLATFIVEILAGMDPLLFRFDGVIYAVCTIAWALIVGFVFSASVDWADETT